MTPANDRHPIHQIAADLVATCREQRANLERLSASLDESIRNDERRAQEIEDAGQAVLDAFPAEVTP